MTVRDVRIAAAWLRRQARQQEAQDAWLEHQRLCLRDRVARQPRDARGRWASEAHDAAA